VSGEIFIGVFANVETISLSLQTQEVSLMARPTNHITSTEACERHIADLVRDKEWIGYQQPMAYAVGVARMSKAGAFLDTWFPLVNYVGENKGVAVLLADQVGYLNGVMNALLTGDQIMEVVQALEPYRHDGKEHPNLEILDMMLPIASHDMSKQCVIVSFIGDTTTMAPEDVSDAYLRLHLLSHRKVQPHGVNLDGIFGMLPNNVWTNQGPVAREDLTGIQASVILRGEYLQVSSWDKFPPMLQYVRPSGVRVADGARVRLGAHLAEGTTVMHEGFVNFNAGTLGPSMVEGRISAGVIVGDGSDIGGGASTQGTLSGGGKTVISIGEGCLLGANSGLGIPLGDRCTVEAGLYLTAGTLVTTPTGEVVKAAELTGRDDLLFRRHSVTGTVEVLGNEDADWGGLNTELHDN